MKAFILFTALFSTSVSAAVIAQARQVDGFSPNPCRTKVVEIQDTGEVYSLRCTARPELVTTLSPEYVEVIVKAAADLVPARLNQANPGTPSCMDAPSTTYSVFNAEGVKVDIGGNWGCNDVVYPGTVYNARRLATILEGLFTLATL